MNRPEVNVVATGTTRDYDATYKIKVLKANIPFADQVTDENTKYIIRWNFDLEGETVEIPANCILQFEGGSLSNGSLVGNNTEIEAELENVFNGIAFSGQWKEKDAYVDWFVSDLESDITDIVNGILDRFGRLVFSRKTYIVNGPVVLPGEKCILLKEGSTLLKEEDPDVPMFYVIGNNNTIQGEGKASRIKSNVCTANGVIAISDYDGATPYYGATAYNKIDNVAIIGVTSFQAGVEIQSKGLYFLGQYGEYARYYSSFTNLSFYHFNVGIHLRGDSNANIYRDLMFTDVGATPEAGTRETEPAKAFPTDSAILFESSYYLDGEGHVTSRVAGVAENVITNGFHTGSRNATTLYFKDNVMHNHIFAIGSEPGGYWTRYMVENFDTSIVGVIGKPHDNIIIGAYVNFAGISVKVDFHDRNILINNNSVRSKYAYVYNKLTVGGDISAGGKISFANSVFDDNSNISPLYKVFRKKISVNANELFCFAKLGLSGFATSFTTCIRVNVTLNSYNLNAGGFYGTIILEKNFGNIYPRFDIVRTDYLKIFNIYEDGGYLYFYASSTYKGDVQINIEYNNTNQNITIPEHEAVQLTLEEIVVRTYSGTMPTYPKAGDTWFNPNKKRLLICKNHTSIGGTPAYVEYDGVPKDTNRIGNSSQIPSATDIYPGFRYMFLGSGRTYPIYVGYINNGEALFFEPDGAHAFVKRTGTKAQRPTSGIYVGFQYMQVDQVNGTYPIWASEITRSGSGTEQDPYVYEVAWVKADGTPDV